MVYAAPLASLPDIDAFPPTEPISLPLPIDAPADLRLERTGFDGYAVCCEDRTLGFIDVVGRVHVVLLGPRADRAVEIAQVLDLRTAVQRLADAR